MPGVSDGTLFQDVHNLKFNLMEISEFVFTELPGNNNTLFDLIKILNLSPSTLSVYTIPYSSKTLSFTAKTYILNKYSELSGWRS